eukprot:TRINITY_DN5243_c0_g1_i3.p1 TRINITY_DN5243_c0_g1~~TRINITY_DN5243_c0_g1_i3.p1  ORF type:complete len:268 (-),score=62.72 TRINITY_DN5243_c0_g1_i3:128-931(-)
MRKVESVDEEGSIIDHGSDEYDPLLVPTQSLSSQPTITISTDANDPGEFTIPPLLYPDDHEFEDDLHGDNLLDSNKESFSSDSTEATSDNRTSISNLIYGINSKNNEENIPVARGDIDLIDPDFPSIEEYTLAESDPRMSFPDLEIEDIENISLAENSMADLTDKDEINFEFEKHRLYTRIGIHIKNISKNIKSLTHEINDLVLLEKSELQPQIENWEIFYDEISRPTHRTNRPVNHSNSENNLDSLYMPRKTVIQSPPRKKRKSHD